MVDEEAARGSGERGMGSRERNAARGARGEGEWGTRNGEQGTGVVVSERGVSNGRGLGEKAERESNKPRLLT